MEGGYLTRHVSESISWEGTLPFRVKPTVNQTLKGPMLEASGFSPSPFPFSSHKPPWLDPLLYFSLSGWSTFSRALEHSPP